MYKKILVPLDGSKRAETILDHVEELARSSRAKIVLLTALEHKFRVSAEGIQSHLDRGELEQKMNKAESYLVDLADNLNKKDVQAQPLVVYGPTVEVITKIAEEEDILQGAHPPHFPVPWCCRTEDRCPFLDPGSHFQDHGFVVDHQNMPGRCVHKASLSKAGRVS